MCSWYGIRLDAHGIYLLSDGSGFGKKVITFGADMSSSAHIHNRKKDILIFVKSPTQRLDNTTFTQGFQIFQRLW